jgi:hypothetical protein
VVQIEVKECMFSRFSRSNGLRWNAYRDALLPVPLERHNLHSHAKHGNEKTVEKVLVMCVGLVVYILVVVQIEVKECMFSRFSRSNGLRWNAYRDALRPVPLERHNLHSHAKHGNEKTIFPASFNIIWTFVFWASIRDTISPNKHSRFFTQMVTKYNPACE